MTGLVGFRYLCSCSELVFLLLHQHLQVFPFGMLPIPFSTSRTTHVWVSEMWIWIQVCTTATEVQMSTQCCVCPGLNLLLVHSYRGNRNTLSRDVLVIFSSDFNFRDTTYCIPSSAIHIELPNPLVLYVAQWDTLCEQMHITLCTLSQTISLWLDYVVKCVHVMWLA